MTVTITWFVARILKEWQAFTYMDAIRYNRKVISRFDCRLATNTPSQATSLTSDNMTLKDTFLPSISAAIWSPVHNHISRVALSVDSWAIMHQTAWNGNGSHQVPHKDLWRMRDAVKRMHIRKPTSLTVKDLVGNNSPYRLQSTLAVFCRRSHLAVWPSGSGRMRACAPAPVSCREYACTPDAERGRALHRYQRRSPSHLPHLPCRTAAYRTYDHPQAPRTVISFLSVQLSRRIGCDVCRKPRRYTTPSKRAFRATNRSYPEYTCTRARSYRLFLSPNEPAYFYNSQRWFTSSMRWWNLSHRSNR